MPNRTKLIQLCALLALLALSASFGTVNAEPFTDPGGPPPKELPPVTPGVFNGDVRRIPGSRPVIREDQPAPHTPGDTAPGPVQLDPALQTVTTNAPAPAPLAAFTGLDEANWGAGWPPDTNGDVGPSYYIQTVNTSVGIFRKSDGTRVAAFTYNSLFSAAHSGTPCDNSNQGDPVALYDPLADRWIVSDFAWANFASGAMYQCMAVSQSGDPVSGGWYFYAWQVENGGLLPDYPKLGVWPDGIYMSANVFATTGNQSFQNVKVWAFNRAEMEAGASAHSVTFDLPSKVGGVTVFSLLPSNTRSVSGTPPAGRENLFASIFGSFNARIWKFHVDWNNTANSSLNGPTDVPIAPFNAGPSNVPEQSGNNVDTLSYRLMMQNQYTNLGGSESLWLAHTVGNGGSPNIAQVRWYQLNVSGGTIAASPVQQSTWSPDSKYRFMPSLAVDQAGDMMLGYSVSDATMFPSIRYAGRLASDPPNSLGQGETSLIEGSGFQCCAFSNGQTNTRWGDYSAMTIDPDGCTFWYTNEYYNSQPSTLAQDNWQTEIGAFRFASCGIKQNTSLSVAAAAGAYGGTTTLTATLRTSGTALFGRSVSFTLQGTSAGSALTNGSGVASLSNVSLSGINAGTYLTGVVAAFAGDSAYNPSGGANTLVVSKADQAISFGPLAGKTYGDSPFTITATASSSLAVSFGAAGNCSVLGNTVSISAAGSCTITATQAGNGNYNAAPNVPQSFNIAKTNQTVSLTGEPASATYSTTFSVTATASSGLTVTLASSGACSNAGTLVTMTTGTGTCTLAAAQGGNANYNPAPTVTQTTTALKATALVTLTNLSQTYDGTPKPAGASTNPPGLSVTLTYNGVLTAPTNAGSYALAGSISDLNYSGTATNTLVIAKANQAISFGPLANKTYGDPDFGVSATAGSGLLVSFTAGATDQCTVSGSTVHITAAGGCTITATQSGNLNFKAAPPVVQMFSIAKADQSMSFTGAPASAAYSTTFSVTATASSGLTVTVGASGACSNNGTRVTMTNSSGTCTLTASQVGDGNYNSAPTLTQTTTATQAIALVTLSNLNQTYDGTPKPAGVSTSPPGLSVTLTYSGSPAAPTNAGSYAVAASVSDVNYTGTAASTLVIAKANQSIAFAPLANKIYGDPPFGVSATASSGLAVGFALGVSDPCTLFGSTVTITGAGSCTVTATQAGAANYNGAAPVPRTFSIAKAGQTITFGPLADKTYGDPSFVVTATATSGLAVSFSAGGTCSVAGSTVSASAAGACTLTATQSGNLNFNAAPPVAQSFNIARAAATVVLSNLQQTYDGGPKAASATTTPGGLAVALTYDGTSTPSIDAGSYAVLATVSDPNYQGSTTGTLLIAQAGATLTLGNLAQTYDGTPRVVTVTTNPPGLSGVAVSYDGALGAPVDAGTYVVSASLSNLNYAAAVVSDTLVVTKADQLINFAPLADVTYGAAPFTLTASATSGLPVGFAAAGQCTVSGSLLTITAAGSCTISATQSGNGNYFAAPLLARSFSIATAAATLSLSNLVQFYDGTPKAVSVSTSPPGLSGVRVTYDGALTPPSAPGSYAVVASLENPNYHAANASGTLVIFGPDAPRVYLPLVVR